MGNADGSGGNDNFEYAKQYISLTADKKISWINWNYSDDPLSGAVFKDKYLPPRSVDWRRAKAQAIGFRKNSKCRLMIFRETKINFLKTFVSEASIRRVKKYSENLSLRFSTRCGFIDCEFEYAALTNAIFFRR